VTAAPLRGSRVHAVVFRQTFDGVLSADGLATVAVVRAKRGWKVVYASSSLAPDTAVIGKRLLRPVAAWRHAARAAGARVAQVAPLGMTANGSVGLAAAGFSGVQTVRPTMFDTADEGRVVRVGCVPVGQPPARRTRPVTAVLRCLELRGDTRQVRRDEQPVHGQASYHGDQDNDPEQQRRLQRERARQRGARRRVQVFGQNPTVDGTKVPTG
jgi:hypothetical protein